jgi:cytochrome c oxidase assembly factor CtaG
MSYIDHWSFDPFLIFAIILVAWHEIGLARLRRSDPPGSGKRRLRSVAFYAGLAVVLLAVDSPVEYFADRYFFMHMVQHLLLMFAAPTLIVAGAPWQPLADAIPRRAAALAAGWSRPLRAAVGWLLRPWVTVVAFNAVMLFWHIPAALDLAENNPAVKIWLLHSSYLIVGILFWLLFIPSPPLRMRMPPEGQAIALVATNVIMWLLAMSMSFLTQTSWYPVFDHIAGVTLPPFADQQIGAGILWVCGDFWAIPALIVAIRRIINADGSMGSAIDKMLGRQTGSTGGSGWASRAGR